MDSQGPLIDLYFFDVSLLKHCTLHIVNLTLLGISNGAVLLLIQNWSAVNIVGIPFSKSVISDMFFSECFWMFLAHFQQNYQGDDAQHGSFW